MVYIYVYIYIYLYSYSYIYKYIYIYIHTLHHQPWRTRGKPEPRKRPNTGNRDGGGEVQRSQGRRASGTNPAKPGWEPGQTCVRWNLDSS